MSVTLVNSAPTPLARHSRNHLVARLVTRYTGQYPPARVAAAVDEAYQ